MTWASDYARFRNPPGYPAEPAGTSWLYDRYPTVTDEQLGVKSRRFVDWMFPSFFGHVRNTLGFVEQRLEKGQTLTVRIGAHFPVQSLGAEKRIVVTTRNGLGGRHTVLAYLLLLASLLCLAMAAAVA